MNAYKSVFRAEISDHIAMRSSIYSERTMRATVSVLLEFDGYLCDIGLYEKKLNEPIVENWIQGLSGKSHTVAGKVSQLRLFCKHLHTGGIDAYIPPAYKARDEYVPYLFSDEEYEQIFCTADNINFSVNQANPWSAAWRSPFPPDTKHCFRWRVFNFATDKESKGEISTTELFYV